MEKVFLLRYDTERRFVNDMKGFFDKAIEVHRSEGIPATFFCTGRAIDEREEDFRNFFNEVKDDPLFDIQDHSYMHIGVGYTEGKSVEELKEDYEKSFATHERVFGRRPTGVSICGTRVDGARLDGFDQTEKSRQEFEMLANLGVRMLNSFLVGVDEATEFSNYGVLGHPEIMGFPSAYSDTQWQFRQECGDPMEFVRGRITDHYDKGQPMPLMLHDWVAWTRAPDKELTHVKEIAAFARKKGYELKTHLECYRTPSLWQSGIS